jgi:hypothetical protein
MEQETALTSNAASVVVDEFEIKPGMGLLCAMDRTGDTRLQWDNKNPEEVAKARTKFDELLPNHMAYTLNAKGQEEILTKFDPNAERIIMHKKLIGG